MSNELNTTKILVCPKDEERTAAADFDPGLDNTHISYFIGLDADERFPSSLLSGDRNLTNGAQPVDGILNVTTNQTVGWTKKIHNNGGNVLLGDGSVQQFTSSGLMSALTRTDFATNRLAMTGPY
jgi:prepilin-type processing-associated H-X9-DG protein